MPLKCVSHGTGEESVAWIHMQTRICWREWKANCEDGFLADPDGNLMRLLSESLSLSVQMTDPKAYLAESIPAAVEELMRLYMWRPPARQRIPRSQRSSCNPSEDACGI